MVFICLVPRLSARRSTGSDFSTVRLAGDGTIKLLVAGGWVLSQPGHEERNWADTMTMCAELLNE